jgi:hypothetical protein
MLCILIKTGICAVALQAAENAGIPLPISGMKSVVPNSAGETQSDKDWEVVEAEIAKGRAKKTDADWDVIERKAREFRNKHPNDPRGAEARKLEIRSGLARESKQKRKLESVQASARAYLQDKSVPAKDRFEIDALQKESEVELASVGSREAKDQIRIGHARKLIEDYHDDPRGYGYLLSLAKAQEGKKGRKLAADIVGMSAPQNIKDGAQVLIEQRDMEGRQLAIVGVDLRELSGKPVVIYAWSLKRPDIFKAVRQWSDRYDIHLIGINLDQNTDPAKQLPGQIGVPGIQIYNGGGIEVGVAAALKFTMASSVYILNSEGVVLDTCAHTGTRQKLDALAVLKGGSK